MPSPIGGLSPTTRTTHTMGRGALVGSVGAATVLVTDSVVTRIPGLNGSFGGRAVGRLALAGGAAALAGHWHAPKGVVEGIVAGAVLVTLLDGVVRCIPRSNAQPPVATDWKALGAPWAPMPLYLPALPAPGLFSAYLAPAYLDEVGLPRV